MARPAGDRAWLSLILCGVLTASVLLNIAAAVAAWHRYRLLLALPPEHAPNGSEALLRADMWFGNLRGWREAAFAASLLLLIMWLESMRGRADVLWPQGQRRSRGWLIFGWIIPGANLFVPKMFVNDLWAAAQPGHRRGHPLLTAWWLSVLVSVGYPGNMLMRASHAAHASQARAQMRAVMVGDALFVVAAALTIAVVWRLSSMLEHAPGELAGSLPSRDGWQPAPE